MLSPKHQFSIIKNEANLPLSVYLGVLGMPGKPFKSLKWLGMNSLVEFMHLGPGETAFYGLEVVGKPIKGETIFVSSGASAVGS